MVHNNKLFSPKFLTCLLEKNKMFQSQDTIRVVISNFDFFSLTLEDISDFSKNFKTFLCKNLWVDELFQLLYSNNCFSSNILKKTCLNCEISVRLICHNYQACNTSCTFLPPIDLKEESAVAASLTVSTCFHMSLFTVVGITDYYKQLARTQKLSNLIWIIHSDFLF